MKIFSVQLLTFNYLLFFEIHLFWHGFTFFYIDTIFLLKHPCAFVKLNGFGWRRGQWVGPMFAWWGEKRGGFWRMVEWGVGWMYWVLLVSGRGSESAGWAEVELENVLFDLLATKTATILLKNYYVLIKLSKTHSRGWNKIILLAEPNSTIQS